MMAQTRIGLSLSLLLAHFHLMKTTNILRKKKKKVIEKYFCLSKLLHRLAKGNSSNSATSVII